MTGDTASGLIPGTPWGTDVLESPPSKGFSSPNSFDVPSLGVMKACPPQERTVSDLTFPHLGSLVNTGLRNQRMDTVRDLAEMGGREPHVPGLISPLNVVVGERGVRVDKTRTKRARLWALAAGVLALGIIVTIFLAHNFFFNQIDGLITIALLLVAVAGFTIFAMRINTTDFWSEVTYVAYGSTSELSAGGKKLIGLPATYQVKVWAGVARSENYSSKYGSGRTVKQVFPSPETTSRAVGLVESLQVKATETPLA